MKIYIIPVLASILFFSCKKEKPYWDTDIVAPVATSSLNLTNLFPDTLLESNSDGSLKIALETDLFKLAADTLLKLPDTTFENVYIPFTFPGFYTYQPNDNINFLPNNEVKFDIANGVKLKEAIIRSGKLHIEIYNPLRQPTIFTCSVLSAKLNNVPLSIAMQMPAGTQASPAYRDTFVDVSNYRVDFSGAIGNQSNTVIENMAVLISPAATADTLKYGDTLRTNITFVDIVPQFGRGYFGTQTLNLGPDTTVFDVFNQISSGTLGLDEATIELLVSNQFGIDLRSTITALQSLNPQNATVTLTGPSIGSSFNVGRATATGNPASPVIPYNKTLVYNELNSNLTQFIGNLPRSISYSLNSQLNPLGNVSGFNDFVYYGTSLSARMKAEIPLKFSANNIVLLDTTEFDVSSLTEQIDNVNEGKLRLRATNSYPFNLSLTGVLLDENNNPIETLISGPNNVILSPNVDGNGISVGSRETWLEIPFDRSKLESMKKAKKIAYYIGFNTTNQPNSVTFLNSYKLDLLLTADFNYSVNK
ncbi:MAG: hypothetical protein K0S33_2610 [Bacteroidetes bacterium]|jgi:hypothetical protein|nr:hypothetical protein [Bacteroidota bacterium]